MTLTQFRLTQYFKAIPVLLVLLTLIDYRINIVFEGTPGFDWFYIIFTTILISALQFIPGRADHMRYISNDDAGKVKDRLIAQGFTLYQPKEHREHFVKVKRMLITEEAFIDHLPHKSVLHYTPGLKSEMSIVLQRGASVSPPD